MPGQNKSLEDQRLELVSLCLQEGANVSELCRRFGVSRKTLYKWVGRHRSGEGLGDRSRRPSSSPGRAPEEAERLVLQVRGEHPCWGGRKIVRVLRDRGEPSVSASTATEILRRHGLLGGPRAGEPRAHERFERGAPNDLWQMDFKGHFPLVRGGRCHPFDALDDHSRFSLCLRACADETSRTVEACLTDAFRLYGLPTRMLCDRGGPWRSGCEHGLTELGVWLSLLGIRLIHGRPYHPQTQGKDERFHLTLKNECLTRNYDDLAHCQIALDAFRSDYNLLRPHEALGLRTPASRYRPSAVRFPEGPLREPEYTQEFRVRKVQQGGLVSFAGREHKASAALAGHRVGIRPADEDGLFEVRFGPTFVRAIDLRQNAH